MKKLAMRGDAALQRLGMIPGEVIPSAASSDPKVFSPTDSSPWAGGTPPASDTWRIMKL